MAVHQKEESEIRDQATEEDTKIVTLIGLSNQGSVNRSEPKN